MKQDLLKEWLEEEYQLAIKEREKMIESLSYAFKCMIILPIIITIALIPTLGDYGNEEMIFTVSIIPLWIILSKLIIYLVRHDKRQIKKLKRTIKKEMPTEQEQLEFLKEMNSRASKKVTYTYGSLDNHIVIGKHFMFIKTYKYILVDLRKIKGITVKLNKYPTGFFHCDLIIIQSDRRLKAEIVSLKAVCEVLKQLITVLKALGMTIEPGVDVLMDKVVQDQEKDYIVTQEIISLRSYSISPS